MSSGDDPGATLHAALDGDGQAWARIVADHQDLLWWIARSHRLDDAEASDLVQTVWLALLRHGRSIEQPQRLAGWLATTAKREAWKRLRHAKSTIPTEIEHEADRSAEREVDEGLLEAEALGEALVAFRGLSASCQELLRLVCTDPPLSYVEVAARLGKTPGYIGPTRARCLDRLRHLISTQGEEVP